MMTFIFLLFPIILPAAISVKANHNSSHSKGNYKNNHMLMNYNNDLSDSLEFLQLAQSLTPVTNKVTDAHYYEMYGQFLIPYVRQKLRTNQKIKFLEIGLGCGQSYGPGSSVQLWKKILGKKKRDMGSRV